MSTCLEKIKVSSIEQMRAKRRYWVESSRDNNFDEGINNLLTQLYPDNAHFIYELLQNAEDTFATVVRFTLSDSAVDFEHEGKKLFSLEDICSITSIGNSTKRDDPTAIGKFGVGFKAVFAYTNTPEIHSGDFHFRILDLFVPEPVEPCQMGEKATKFVFPFNHPKKSAKQAETEIAKGLCDLGDNTLLFLKHIRKIEYLLPNGSLGSLERFDKNNGQIEIRATKPGGEETISHWLRFEKDVEVTDEDGEPKICRIAIAYSLAEEDRKKKQSKWKIVPIDRGEVSIYFPAEKEDSHLRFHIHAPFASTVARDSVRDCQANEELRDRLAELVVESLTTIREAGMLDISFLAVLPIPADNLPEFYDPIREAIVEAFREQDLTPTRKIGEHRSAGALYRGPAEIADVIGDEGLSQLTGESARLWAANAPQKNQREDRFIQSLEIKEWGWSELVSIFKLPHLRAWQDNEKAENAAHKKRIETFIQQMNDAKLMRFYALFGEAVDAHNVSIRSAYLDNQCIARIKSEGSDQHVAPKDAYFQQGDDTASPSDVFFIKREVYSAGKSDSQKRLARFFLENVGVRPYDEKAAIEKILKEYGTGHVPSSKVHLSHVRQFVGYWLVNTNSIGMFRPITFLNGEDKDGTKSYCKASDLYLDSPYIETGLAELFNDNKLAAAITRPKKRLSPDYRVIEKFEEFAVALGAMKQLEIRTYKATEMQKDSFEKVRKKTDLTTDEDYFINGLYWNIECCDSFIGIFDLNRHKSMALSRAIWSAMSGADPKVLTARYVPNKEYSHEEKSKPSWLVDYLAGHSWVPDKDGNFLRPTEVTQDTLHSDFKFDDRNGWLTAIKFGEDTKKQSDEYRSKDDAAKADGYASAEEKDEWKKVRDYGISPKEVLAQLAQRQRKIDLPDKVATKPERRAGKIADEARNTPAKTTEVRPHSFNPGYSEAQGDARTYLENQYTNDDGVMFCQLCQAPQPVMLNGKPSFAAVDCVRGINAHHKQNNLALCPNHEVMYLNGGISPDIVQCAILECEGQKIPLNLAGNEVELYFTQQHLGDLRVVLTELNSEEI